MLNTLTVCCPSLCLAILLRYLAEQEMRLHLLAEDLDAAVEDSSARALQRVPVAIREVSHLKVAHQIALMVRHKRYD